MSLVCVKCRCELGGIRIRKICRGGDFEVKSHLDRSNSYRRQIVGYGSLSVSLPWVRSSVALLPSSRCVRVCLPVWEAQSRLCFPLPLQVLELILSFACIPRRAGTGRAWMLSDGSDAPFPSCNVLYPVPVIWKTTGTAFALSAPHTHSGTGPSKCEVFEQ